jgi:hypothetical protein
MYLPPLVQCPPLCKKSAVPPPLGVGHPQFFSCRVRSGAKKCAVPLGGGVGHPRGLGQGGGTCAVAPKKCSPPASWGLDTPGGPPFWTKILVEPKSDLGVVW